MSSRHKKPISTAKSQILTFYLVSWMNIDTKKIFCRILLFLNYLMSINSYKLNKLPELISIFCWPFLYFIKNRVWLVWLWLFDIWNGFVVVVLFRRKIVVGMLDEIWNYCFWLALIIISPFPIKIGVRKFLFWIGLRVIVFNFPLTWLVSIS